MIQLYQYITKNQRKRTLKLLQDTKNYLGVDGYILMKKMLTVSIMIDYLQNKEKYTRYIPYGEFLSRNEYAVKRKLNIINLKKINGFYSEFFGVNTEQIINTIPSLIPSIVIKKWTERNSLYEFELR